MVCALKAVDKALSSASMLEKEVEALKRVGGCPYIETLLFTAEDRHWSYIVSHLCVHSSSSSSQRKLTTDTRHLTLDTRQVTEYASGGELFDAIIAQGHYTEHDASMVSYQLLEAVNHLHRCGIIHRDLKPENVLLARKGCLTDIRLADFGVAKVTSGRLRADTFIGSLVYMAPEILSSEQGTPKTQKRKRGRGQASSSTEYTQAVDFWSCGVIIYALLSGCTPWDEAPVDKFCRNVS